MSFLYLLYVSAKYGMCQSCIKCVCYVINICLIFSHAVNCSVTHSLFGIVLIIGDV